MHKLHNKAATKQFFKGYLKAVGSIRIGVCLAVWSCSSLYITKIQLINKNSVIKLLQYVAFQRRSTHLNVFPHKGKKKQEVYIKISFYCNTRFLISPVTVTVSTGANKLLQQRGKKPAASVRKMDTEIQKGEKKRHNMILCNYTIGSLSLAYVLE